MEVLFDPATAARWLCAHGVRRTPATLRKERCLGTGPKFRRFNRRPVYTETDLVAWIKERLSEPVASNAEAEAHS